MVNDEIQKGWKSLPQFIGISESKLKRMRPELMGCGAVFLVRRGRGRIKTLCWFPSEIKKFLKIKASKAEIL